LRADRLSAYGYERETSPFMDWIAKNGIRFEKTISQSSWTKASMAAIWTGTYPARNGILRWMHALPEGARMPAEIFKDAGYKTAGIYRNGWVSANFGFQQGFDVYYRPKPSSAAKVERGTHSASPLQGNDSDVTESAIEFLKSHAADRFLLYLHYMDVHQYTYDELSARFGTSYSDSYDNAIRWVDRNVGVILETLENEKLSGRTLLVIAADHGEAFLEHGREGHGRDLFREVIEVPFLIQPPFILEGGVTVQEMVENVDIWPTILDLVGLEPLQGAQGRSLVPAILAAAGGQPPAADGSRPSFAHLDRSWGTAKRPPEPMVMVTRGSQRLIRPLVQVDEDDKIHLYDHASDPLEQQDLSEAQPEVVKELLALTEQYLAPEAAPWGRASEVELDQMQLDQLRALGYAIDPKPDKKK
jgi:arylsulfatase A-like enzyme